MSGFSAQAFVGGLSLHDGDRFVDPSPILIRVEPEVSTFDLFRSAEKAGGVTTLTVVSLFE